MIFHPAAALWNCLDCGKQITEFEYDLNNGVCDGCPRPAVISSGFIEVIRKKADNGDLDALKIMHRLGFQI